MGKFKTLDDLNVAGKRVLLRGDLNVPTKDGKVTDATRLERLAPTIEELARKGAKVIVLSHFGRPKPGKPDPTQSLKPVADALSVALGGKKIAFASDCIGPAAKAVVDALPQGGVAVFENTRFHAGEEENDPAFAKKLAEQGDIFVNDAFSAAHRAHASTEGLAHLLPSAAGRLMQAELEALGKALDHPTRPVMAIVGGAKISTKLDLLGNLVNKVDHLVIGGGMANTFLHAQGISVGKSLCERDLAATAQDILKRAAKAGCKINLPIDAVVASEFKAGEASRTVDISAVPADQMILDLGQKSSDAIAKLLGQCKTLVWNGPLGAFEIKPFDAATVAIARTVSRLTKAGRLISVGGGGDTVAALNAVRVTGDLTYVSAAGGAFLEWMEGKPLPGVVALQG
ncbi:MAG: phosphoglycerate kinase [Alphaproteobacteria bacterium]|nr:phosphoglycerate kinase [Alphaproteobacteria bacterium]